MSQMKARFDRALVNAFLYDSRLTEEGWEVSSSQDRPDFLVQGPEGQMVGLEMTELSAREHGRARDRAHELTAAVEAELLRFLAPIGGRGAIADGHVGA